MRRCSRSATYDSRGNALTLVTPAGSWSFSYDARNNPLTSTDPTGLTAVMTYDGNGNLIRRQTGAAVETYTVSGGLVTHADAGGASTDYTYSAGLPLPAIARAGGVTISYSYNAAGCKTSESGPSPASYTCDGMHRVTSMTDGAGNTTTYGYDAAGNRLSATKNPTLAPPTLRTGYTYDAANRLLSESSITSAYESTATAYTWDADGRMTSAVTTKPDQTRVSQGYIWDAADRMTGYSRTTVLPPSATPTPAPSPSPSPNPATDPNVEATYTYDGDGLRMSKALRQNNQSIPGGGTYTWDVAREHPTIISDGPVQYGGHEYIWGVELVGSNGRYAVTDALGSVRGESSATGLTRTRYDAFGAVLADSDPKALPFGFAGELTDEESGLTYLRARYMDPKTGRFLSRDPLPGTAGSPASQNGYNYANNNPVRWVDPSGRECRPEASPDSALPGGNCIGGGGAGGGGGGPPSAPGPTQSRPASSVGAMRRLEYEPSPKHGPEARQGGHVSPQPVNGQAALDYSVQVKATSSGRIGIDYATNEFVVFRETSPGVFHGYVVGWSDLHIDQRNALIDAGMTDRRGRILITP